MKILGTVPICGIEYEVRECTLEECPQLSDCYGFAVHSHAMIVIRADLPVHIFRNTVLHEIQHGIWEHGGVAKIDRESDDFEEAFIQIYTPHLIAALAAMKKWRLT